eukprot:TRINITY_DN7351_c0_g1_i5.p1 TRINITY_DN7351_c0_g1~~TRINITY_DN7351_c0_g1_i5.p1  ORF type:complete len:186 (+),score=2.10 TRINITY_DN7351_c0_g1_i5:250-807(+)
MQSLNDPTGEKTSSKGLFWAGTMFTLPFISTAIGFTNPMFLLTGTLTNAFLFRSYLRWYQNRTNRDARDARIAGFIQLLAFFGFLTFHLQDREHIKGFKQLEEMRVEGKNFCLYHLHKFRDSSHLCVYLFGKSKKEEADSVLPIAISGFPSEARAENRSAVVETTGTDKTFVTNGLRPSHKAIGK